jgi:hypothetical protein
MSAADFKLSRAFSGIDPNGMKWRGVWGIPGIYQYGDVVIGPDNESYICVDFSGSIGEDPTTNPAIWQLLSSGTATAVSVAVANGAGVSVAESPANTFTISSALAAGAGISLSPSGVDSTLTIANTGVNAVSAGTGISIGGTSTNPSVINTGVTSLTTAPGSGLSVNFTNGDVQINKVYPSQSQIIDTRLTLTPPLSATTPPGGAVTPMFYVPVVANGVYTLTSYCSIASSAASGATMQIVIAPSLGGGAGPNGQTYALMRVPETTAGQEVCASVTFTVPATFTNYGFFVQGVAGVVGALTGTISSCYLTRWS